MQDLFIELLPPWVETTLQPAFYDAESGTVLQQTARMYAKINDIIEIVNHYNNYDQEINDLQNQMQALVVANEKFKHDIQNSLDDQIDDFFNQVITLIDNQVKALRIYSDEGDRELKEYIDNVVIGNITLYNPVTGLIDSLQNVIGSIYSVSRINGITATEYDALELTATEYDSKEITAYDYDINGKTILIQ